MHSYLNYTNIAWASTRIIKLKLLLHKQRQAVPEIFINFQLESPPVCREHDQLESPPVCREHVLIMVDRKQE